MKSPMDRMMQPLVIPIYRCVHCFARLPGKHKKNCLLNDKRKVKRHER